MVTDQLLWSILWIKLLSMETIQFVLDSELLHAAEKAARRRKVNRSVLIREALRDYLKKLEIRELEERDRRGYQLKPQHAKEIETWEAVAQWPQD